MSHHDQGADNMAESTIIREVAPEQITRITSGGRKLNYQLGVIQQPERARACGSGAKSSADRRPVDPPPVVELRIFELGAETKDITSSYNANFFLYATLEPIRPPGPRGPSSQPVLTGMPVSGMAYLDRPREAGYFVFPDLSVRHEGKYKLCFNLFEETKDAKDRDSEEEKTNRGSVMAASMGSFDWKIQVKSVPFTVFSAKKFPGLKESTPLSRVVAEQGCRVRIRRDVRMRRRDGKDEASIEDGYERVRRTPSPAQMSEPLQYGYKQEQDRRPSSDHYQPHHAQAYRLPQAPPPRTPSYTPAYPPSHAYASSPVPPPQPRYVPPPQQSAHAPQPYYQSEYPRQAPAVNDNYARERAQHEASMREREAYERASHDEGYYRRTSVGYAHSHAPPPAAPRHDAYARRESSSYGPPPPQYPALEPGPPSHQHLALAPLKMPPIDTKREPSSPIGPLSGGSRLSSAALLPSPASYQDRPSYSHYPPAPPSAYSEPARNGKRPYDTVFGGAAASYHQPLHNGMRPNSIHNNSTTFDEDEDDTHEMETFKMQYKRASGKIYSRELPVLH